MLRKKSIKILTVLMACIIAFSCFTFSASALSSGGAELIGTKQTLMNYSSGAMFTADSSNITDDDNKIVFAFIPTVDYTGAVMHELFFNFNSSIIRGTLTLEFSVNSSFKLKDVKYVGLVNQDNYTFMGDGTYDVLSTNTGRVSYTGVMPTTLSLRIVYDRVTQLSDNGIITKFTFTPEDQTQKIIDNQNENAEKITNGWDSSDKSPDSSAFDKATEIEDGISNSTGKLLIGYDSSGNPIYQEGTLNDLANTGIASVFDSVKIYMQNPKALMAITNFLSDIFYIPEIATILTYSLALAVIPLIVGLGINAMRGSDKRAAAQARAETRKKGKN